MSNELMPAPIVVPATERLRIEVHIADKLLMVAHIQPSAGPTVKELGGRLIVQSMQVQAILTEEGNMMSVVGTMLPWNSVEQIAEWIRAQAPDRADYQALADGILEGRSLGFGSKTKPLSSTSSPRT